MSVPRAPLVPALSIPGLRAATPLATPILLDRSAVLRQVLSARELRGHQLDHRAGFLLSLIDGRATVEEVFDMCPMTEEEALALLAELFAYGIVRI